MSTLDIVELGLDAAGEILTLQRAAYITEAAAHHDFNLPPLTQTLAELKDELSEPSVVALGVRDNGRLIGAVRLRRSGKTIELGRLVVAPDRQGEGLGTRLLLHAETADSAAQEIRLFTGEHSAANIRLYTRHGYRETGRRSAGDYQLIDFVKTLPQSEPGAQSGIPPNQDLRAVAVGRLLAHDAFPEAHDLDDRAWLDTRQVMEDELIERFS